MAKSTAKAQKRNPDGTFKRKGDAATADGDSKRTDLPPPVDAEKFGKSFERPGISEDKATAELGTILEETPATDLEGYPLPEGVDLEALDADERAELRERLEAEGTIEAATDVLEEMFEAGEVDTGEGEADPSPDAEPTDAGKGIPFEKLAEETGVDMDAVLVTAKVDGEEMEVSLREAVNGYQRQRDYTRKTEELARQREEAEAKRDQYAAGLEMLLVGLQRNGVSPEALQGLAAEYQGVKAQIAGELEAARAEAVQEGQAKLREAYGWEDEGEWSEARNRLRTYAHDLGYTDDQLTNVTDYRLFEVLEKARRYDEGREKVKEIGRTKRRKSETLPPGSTATRRARRTANGARKRLAYSGSIDDAAATMVEAGILDGILD